MKATYNKGVKETIEVFMTKIVTFQVPCLLLAAALPNSPCLNIFH